ncbi:carbohydrate kinase family protein [Candidatus Bathyarchaeota archaeon]|nr:carbohydrate kinase family protein [Candidatus Bathyarchaeota archaeon]MBS7628542.1 carbohydrate kinase family protein [Candidatus Bathyarchaeota archaeon]
MRLDIIGFGALNLDKLYRVDRIIGVGEETFIKGLEVSPGGSAANTIVGLARLRMRAGYIGSVADDPEGRYILEDLRRENVNLEGIRVVTGGRSGVCIGFVDEHGERALYIDPGVNDTLTYKDIELEYADSARIIHLTSFVGEKPLLAQKRLTREVRRANITLDPGELYATKGLDKLNPILKKVTAFMPNERELRILTNKSYVEGAEELLSRGVKIVAVKLGERGCYVTDGKEKHLIPASKRKPKDTTGAGDAFCAGFIYGLLKGRDLYTCGRLGNFVASKCISTYGARGGLPSEMELPRL